ncbi:hypothetical protein [Sphingomonas jatrophae]|uniref:Uncharacterized protein n=1 Tax=Sphingomonas jatrophae TaxID=1166337 RepID=A0A1I6JTU6_9SPHN|nr:hypothetical protein [Sphingomonas jatrophae]SFR82376.1 hypothetical protein SAMN05192580_0861 [Sphingomonas jatrophae]
MTAKEFRQQAAWLDAGAIRFAMLDVAPLLRVYAAEARARAASLETSFVEPRGVRWSGEAAAA